MHYIKHDIRMIKRLVLTGISLLLGWQLAVAQVEETVTKIRPFRQMDVTVSAGTTGLGIGVSTLLSDKFQLRSGLTYMPQFKPKMSFGVGLDGGEDENGNYLPVTPGKFQEMADLFSQFTGCYIDDRVDMVGEPTFFNFNLLVDFFPFKDKRWHLTAGVYMGPSQIAKAYNTTEDMPSLFSVKLYNKMYESAYEDKPLLEYNGQYIYLDPDVCDKLIRAGRMSITLGERVDGSGPYHMEPDHESMAKVKMKVNPIRPYIGFGYGSSMLSPLKNSKYTFSFDAGVMFWGGTPELITHDGTNLAKDVRNIGGKVGRYVKAAKFFKVCPMVNFTIARRIF